MKRNQCPICKKKIKYKHNQTKMSFIGLDDNMHEYWVHFDCAVDSQEFKKSLNIEDENI